MSNIQYEEGKIGTLLGNGRGENPTAKIEK